MTVNNERRLVLWDIDHTLVDVAGLGRTWYEAALRSLGTELHTHPEYGGRTERAISTDVLTSHAIAATEENLQLLWQNLTAESRRSGESIARQGRALAGAAAAVTELRRRGAVQTLVTGNLPEISRHKLAPFGLEEHLDLEVGGYGTLSVDRPVLVAHAIRAASERYGTFTAEQVAVIGDTPHDVEAALANGAIAIGVATGRPSAEELAAAGAHHVLPGLADLTAVVKAVYG